MTAARQGAERATSSPASLSVASTRSAKYSSAEPTSATERRAAAASAGSKPSSSFTPSFDGIAEAYVYGSWAARWHGEVGPAPGDVDVLIVGTPDREAVYDALDGIDSTLGREVNVTFASPERWSSAEETFLAALRDRPLVPLTLGHANGEAA